jgi:ABC-type Fe3+ transport system substrate-binding protein
MGTKIAIVLALLAVLGLPLLLRQGEVGGVDRDARRLVVVTPHVPQIRAEFGEAFDRWHRRRYGEPVFVDWRVPGGTSDIIKQLVAQYSAAIRSGAIAPDGSCAPGTMTFDLMFGGGSFDHGRVKSHRDVQVEVADPADPSKRVMKRMAMSVPAGFTQAQLDEWFGENAIGANFLYDKDQHWIGTALSSFGIVYNRDVLARMGLADTTTFAELADPAYAGMVILADPRQSGSVTTAMDAILSNYGWEQGWAILRGMAANARYFTNSSTKPPIDVSQGEAAAALVIDFYGRGQAEGVLAPGQDPATSRVGYVDPVGKTAIDADPVSILRGGPDPELAKRFVEFCMTEEAQALWQFRATSREGGEGNPRGEDGQAMGPRVHQLRRMPVRRVMYERYGGPEGAMVDQLDPFAIASQVKPAGWRDGIGIMMAAFAIDVSHQQREAWRAIARARENGAASEVVEGMERVFFAWPTTPQFPAKAEEGVLGEPLAGAEELPFSAETFAKVREQWSRPGARARLEIRYTEFFRECYARVVEAERTGVVPQIPEGGTPGAVIDAGLTRPTLREGAGAGAGGGA